MSVCRTALLIAVLIGAGMSAASAGSVDINNSGGMTVKQQTTRGSQTGGTSQSQRGSLGKHGVAIPPQGFSKN